jgi:L-asparaginase II
MPNTSYLPILELSRGDAVESVHFGSFAIVNSMGDLVESFGDPTAITFLRSSAKPFQAMPFIENGGHKKWGLSQREIAIICSSHSGTDDHFNVLSSIQSKINVTQDDLLCGIHPSTDAATCQAMLERGEQPSPNRHNCSGKHTGMLAQALNINAPIENYIDINHPVQKRILQCFSEMCAVEVEKIVTGLDGCSAPVFAIPLRSAAFAYARLCDPRDLHPKRASACHTITTAMVSHPDMVSGPGKFDTRLMEISKGKIVSKGGAEGIQQIGIMPDVIKPGSPGVGIILKISDGDGLGRAHPAVTLEILRRLGALTSNELDALSDLGPTFPVKNWRGFTVGEASPIF